MLVSLQAASAFPVVSHHARDVPSITSSVLLASRFNFLFTFDAKQKNRRREAKSSRWSRPRRIDADDIAGGFFRYAKITVYRTQTSTYRSITSSASVPRTAQS